MSVGSMLSQIKTLNGFKYLAIVAILALAIAEPVQAGFREGAAAYARGKFERAIEEFLPLAEQGHRGAQNRMGNMYRRGEGVAQDFVVAAEWYRLAAEQGFSPAQISLGVMYRKGEGVSQDQIEAAKWFRLAAENGSARGQVWLGHLYRDGDGVSQDYAEAARLYQLAAEQGFAWAENSIGNLYLQGKGVEQDAATAFAWFLRAAEQGHTNSQVSVANLYSAGDGVGQDFAEAARWYGLAAQQGSPQAQIALAGLYHDGRGVPQDDDEAAKLYQLAAAQGDEQAASLLGGLVAPAANAPVDSEARTPEETATEEVPDTADEVTIAPQEEPEADGSSEEEWPRIESSARTPGDVQVQLAVYRVPGRARGAWKRLREGHGELFAGLTPTISRIDLGSEDGVFFRLMVGPLYSEEKARDLCAQLKQYEVDCLVRLP